MKRRKKRFLQAKSSFFKLCFPLDLYFNLSSSGQRLQCTCKKWSPVLDGVSSFCYKANNEFCLVWISNISQLSCCFLLDCRTLEAWADFIYDRQRDICCWRLIRKRNPKCSKHFHSKETNLRNILPYFKMLYDIISINSFIIALY